MHGTKKQFGRSIVSENLYLIDIENYSVFSG